MITTRCMECKKEFIKIMPDISELCIRLPRIATIPVLASSDTIAPLLGLVLRGHPDEFTVSIDCGERERFTGILTVKHIKGNAIVFELTEVVI